MPHLAVAALIGRLADEPTDGRFRMPRLVQLAITPGRVATGEWACAEPVGDNAEQHGQTDRTDHLIDRARYVVQVLQRNQREDDRGQPARAEPADKQRRWPCPSPQPSSESATGSIRTTVRLSTA